MTIRALVFLCAAGLAPRLGAQSASRVMTVDALLTTAREGARIGALATARPGLDSILGRQLTRLTRPEVRALSIRAIGRASGAAGTARAAPFARVLRWRPRSTELGVRADESAALDTIALVMGQAYASLLEPVVGLDSADRLLGPLDSFNLARRQGSLELSLEKLRRFERKFGPDAPRLNALEVLLNYGAQHLPVFRPDAAGWPSSLEIVASYVPDYLTSVAGDEVMVTVAELGLRWYLFAPGWGRADGGGVLKPGYVSFGFAAAPHADGALREPWRGAPRLGGFLGWGGAKVALIGGARRRVLVTRQIQIVPFAF